MWDFIAGSINSLPGNWNVLGWIVFIFIGAAVVRGIVEMLAFLAEMTFEGISVASSMAVLFIWQFILAVLLIPFRALKITALHVIKKEPGKLRISLKDIFKMSAFGDTGSSTNLVETDLIIGKIDENGIPTNGSLKTGSYRGQLFSTLSMEKVIEIYRLMAVDASSASFVSQYLDKAYGSQWRYSYEKNYSQRGNQQKSEDRQEQRKSNTEDSHKISYERALEIFDFDKNSSFTQDDLKKRYRSVISKVHPDRGGSNFFAKQANEALEVIKRRKGW